jgi:DNA-binding transcriptional LysR family regulator
VDTLPYETDQLTVITRIDHPLARRKRVKLVDLLDCDFVGMRTGSAINSQLMRAATEANRPFRLRIQVTGYDAMCLMVSAGLGIAIAPQNLTKLFVKRLALAEIKLDEPWAPRQLGICIRSMEALPTAGRLLVDHLQSCANARRLP